jgi:hypothetical protein
VVVIYNYICNQCLSTLNLWVAITLTARYSRVLDTTLCDKVCQWYVVFSWYWVGMFLTCDKYLHDRIYFHLKGRFGHIQLAYSRTRCIEVPVLSQESKRLCICVLKVSSLPLCTVCRLYFGNVLTMWYLLLIFGNKRFQQDFKYSPLSTNTTVMWSGFSKFYLYSIDTFKG